MSLSFETLYTKEDEVCGGGFSVRSRVISIRGEESWKQFQILVNRATNTWPDAPPEIKTFADQITNDGVVLQDYASQDTSKKQRPDDLFDAPDNLANCPRWPSEL